MSTSAIADDTPSGGSPETISVLFTLHEGVDSLDFIGPLQVLHAAKHNPKDASSSAFEFTFASATPHIMTKQDVRIASQISFTEAEKNLSDYDVLIVPGGNHQSIIKDENAQPLPLIKAFAQLQAEDPSRERTLMSVSTGAMLLAKAGVLQGFAATTHPDFNVKLELLCQEASARVAEERTDVMEARYVVNNARFDLGDVDENPFVITKEAEIKSRKDRRRSSVARKGSNAWKQSNMQKDAVARRAELRLGGLRVITSSAVLSGMDASLYLVCALVSQESAEEVARYLGFEWQKGVVVNAIDV